MICWTTFEIIYPSIIVVTWFGNKIMTKHNYFIKISWSKFEIWFSNFYHFRHFLGSPGGLGTLLCTLQLEIGLKTIVNELSKMFNNSIKRHSFKKRGYIKEIHTFKKTERFINGNYRIAENHRFLIWQPFWPWMTFIISWDRVSHVFSISKDTSLSYQLFDTKHSSLWLVQAELWVF